VRSLDLARCERPQFSISAHEGTGGPVQSDPIETGVARMVRESARVSPTDVLDLLDVLCQLLQAQSARFHVADYSLRRLQQIDVHGPVGAPQLIAGTLIGRVFTTGDIQSVGTGPTTVFVPLVDGSCSIGVLELEFEAWDRRSVPLRQ